MKRQLLSPTLGTGLFAKAETLETKRYGCIKESALQRWRGKSSAAAGYQRLTGSPGIAASRL